MKSLDALILEDNADDRFLLERALRKAGIAFDTTWVGCRMDFIQALEQRRPDVILCDYHLPDMDGSAALQIVSRMHPGAPVVIVTGGLSDEMAAELLRAGAQDYVLKDRLARLGSAVMSAIERAAEQQRRLKDAARLKNALAATVAAITRTIEKRDPYTAGHQGRVAGIAVAMASEMGLDAQRIEGLRMAASLHDIGKVYVPSEILTRPGKLTPAEFAIIQAHPEVGYDIVKDIDFPWPVAQMILQHHERLDGTGYPNGLKGDQILLEARIISVADVFEAMTSHRPYRAALPIEVTLDHLRDNRGTHFDPEAVDALRELVRRAEI